MNFKNSFPLRGIMEKKWQCLKVYVLFAKMGERVEKLGGVEWIGHERRGRRHLPPVGRTWSSGQSGQLSLTFEAEAGNWPKSLLSPTRDRQSLNWDGDSVSLISCNMETGRKWGRAQKSRRKKKIKKRNTD